ncbi:MAG: hypothetical protein WC878_06905 [Candidatus Paceibacterota bacterium]|jgi:hypothetical protein
MDKIYAKLSKLVQYTIIGLFVLPLVFALGAMYLPDGGDMLEVFVGAVSLGTVIWSVSLFVFLAFFIPAYAVKNRKIFFPETIGRFNRYLGIFASFSLSFFCVITFIVKAIHPANCANPASFLVRFSSAFPDEPTVLFVWGVSLTLLVLAGIRFRKINKTFSTLLFDWSIFLLISMVFISSFLFDSGFGSARSKGMDAKRLSDVKQFQLAMSLYFDKNGVYPIVTAHTPKERWEELGKNKKFSEYFRTLPVDPCYYKKEWPVYDYQSDVSEKTYSISFQLRGQAGSLAPGIHIATPDGIK